MKAVNYLGLVGVLLSACMVGSADNGSRSDWVRCETKRDCATGEACVAKRCEAIEAEPEPASSNEEREPTPEPRTDASATFTAEPNTAPTVVDAGSPEEAGTPSSAIDAGRAVDASLPDAGGEATAGDSGSACMGEEPCHGPAQCDVTSTSAASGFCDTLMQCTQPVVVDGVAEERTGEASVYCTANDGSLYQCMCTSDSGNFMVTTMAESSWDACTMVVPICAARLRL